jgi:hypothetical protein
MFSSGILLAGAGALTHALPHANEMFAALLGEQDEHHGDESDVDVLEEHDEDHDVRYLEEEDHHA